MSLYMVNNIDLHTYLQDITDNTELCAKNKRHKQPKHFFCYFIVVVVTPKLLWYFSLTLKNTTELAVLVLSNVIEWNSGCVCTMYRSIVFNRDTISARFFPMAEKKKQKTCTFSANVLLFRFVQEFLTFIRENISLFYIFWSWMKLTRIWCANQNYIYIISFWNSWYWSWRS